MSSDDCYRSVEATLPESRGGGRQHQFGLVDCDKILDCRHTIPTTVNVAKGSRLLSAVLARAKQLAQPYLGVALRLWGCWQPLALSHMTPLAC